MSYRTEFDGHIARKVLPLTDEVLSGACTTIFVAGCLYFRSRGERAEIRIDSHGGSLIDSFCVIDVLLENRDLFSTRCVGSAHGTALIILGLGARGRRFAHQDALLSFPAIRPTAGAGQTGVARATEAIVRVVGTATGLPVDAVRRLVGDPGPIGPFMARQVGLIDEVS